MESLRISPISESDIDAVVSCAGGRRAHTDADRRQKRGADYVLGNALIELKCLEDEGFEKSERQGKLAALFRPCFPSRPVVVLDRELLPETQKPQFDRIVEGPVKTAVSSARMQLKQSRSEFKETTCSVLWVVNNGYSTIDHDALVQLVARRARNDTSEIDGVVVSGCYFHSDTFDSVFLWPIDYVSINADCSFTLFNSLRRQWGALAGSYMTRLMQQRLPANATKGPVADTQFDLDHVTFVKPAPPMGTASNFFASGRPRKSIEKAQSFPSVAVVVAELSAKEWKLFRKNKPDAAWLGNSYADWMLRTSQVISGSAIKPQVHFPVTWEGWHAWLTTHASGDDLSVHHYALEVFDAEVKALMQSALDRQKVRVLPPRHILLITEEIGQDFANDVSHIVEVSGYSDEQVIADIIVDQRMVHVHGLALAAAYAIVRGIDFVVWDKDRRYAW